MPSRALDERFMHRALRLAERGRGRTRPNPVVGAVVVRAGQVVGEGWHRAAGLPHAEVEAIRRAGPRARGATLYVSLEPCAHTGRTPPCTKAIIAAGIRRCVVAMRDPHRVVNGKGLRALRKAGVDIETGVLEAEAGEVLAGYVTAHLAARPRATWKVAMTLDGRIADGRGRSKWITGAKAREHVQRMRASSDAIVIGSGTARVDDPRLTVRSRAKGELAPLRVVCDSGLKLPLTLRLFQPGLARGTVVVCRRDAPERRAAELERRGVQVWRLASARGGISPLALARRLVREGCHDVLIESGPTLGSAWLAAGLIDRLACFVAPRVLGAPGLPWCGPLGRASLADAMAGRIVKVSRAGEDVLLEMEIEHVHRIG